MNNNVCSGEDLLTYPEYKWCGILVLLLSFIVYIKTLCPTIFLGDSPEFVTAAYTLGIPHPPGYPLYCLLGKLFTFIPIGEVAYRVNLMSAFFASLACLLLYIVNIMLFSYTKINVEFDKRILFVISMAASLTFAFTQTFWFQALIAEVYTLHTFFVVLLFYILLVWQKTAKQRYLYLFAFLAGLSLGNHHLMLCAYPAYVLFIFLVKPDILKEPKLIIKMSLLFILGLSIYLYLPIRAYASPPINWGNPRTLDKFLLHILRKQFGFYSQSSQNIYKSWLYLKLTFKILLEEFQILGLMLGLIGCIAMLFKNIKIWSVFILSFILMGFFVNWFTNPDFLQYEKNCLQIYNIPSYAVFSIWVFFGLVCILKIIRRFFDKFAAHAFLVAFILLPLFLLKANLPYNYLGNVYIARDFGENILKTPEKDAFLFGGRDASVFPLLYLTVVEGLRPDITIFDPIGYVFEPLPAKLGLKDDISSTEAVAYLKKIDNPIYLVTSLENYKFFGEDVELKPQGILDMLVKEKGPKPKDADFWGTYIMRPGNQLYRPKDFMTYMTLIGYYDGMKNYYLMKGNQPTAEWTLWQLHKIEDNMSVLKQTTAILFAEDGYFKEAISDMEDAIAYDTHNVEIYLNLGTMYAIMKDYPKAIELWNKALKVQPGNRWALMCIKKAQKMMKEAEKRNVVSSLTPTKPANPQR